MWSEPIASPPDHGIPVRETKGQKLKPLLTLRISYFLSYALHYSIFTSQYPQFPRGPLSSATHLFYF